MVGTTASFARRGEVAEQALELDGVVNVREMMSARENVRVVAIATNVGDINRTAVALEEIGLQLEREELMQKEGVMPFNHFRADEIASE